MAFGDSRESFLNWRLLCFFLGGIFGLSFLIWAAGPAMSYRGPGLDDLQSPSSGKGVFRYTEHFGNISIDHAAIDGLTTEECHALFPDLYHEIDRAVAYWKDKGHTISAEDVSILPWREKGLMRILIHENEVRVLETKNAFFLPFRSLGSLPVIQRGLDSATAAGEILPTIEVLLNFVDDADPADNNTHSYWSTSRNISSESQKRLWTMPNFDFHYSPPTGGFEESKRLAMQYDHLSFAEKIPQIVWRGNPVLGGEIRQPLIDLTQDKEWASILGIPSTNPADRLEEFQYCRYAMTVYTEGISFSGRLKFLMNCASLLFVPDIQWIVHYDHLLIRDGPEQNYVPLKRDWSDIEEKVLFYLAHPEEADRIIANMLRTFRARYNTRAAISCYIRELVKGYASVSFTPELYYPMYGGEVQMTRGVSYPRFMMHPRDGYFENETHIDERT